jgi:hypothetical protein
MEMSILLLLNLNHRLEIVQMGNSTSHTIRIRLELIQHKRASDSLLRHAEEVDRYIEACKEDRVNSIAREHLNYSANSISDKDYMYYRAMLERAIPTLPKRLQMDLGSIQVIPMMPSADGGMPHTRPDHLLCFPNLSQLESKTTLVHELWHVHQRMFQESWMHVFSELGWKPWGGLLPEQLENHRRYNPDTINTPLWIFQDTWVPVPIFQDIRSPRIQHVSIWFYRPKSRSHVKELPEELDELFPDLPFSAYEHPYELAAYLLSDPDSYRMNPGFKKLVELVGHMAIS